MTAEPPAATPEPIAVIDRELSLHDQSTDRYLALPFDLPAGTRSFEVTLEVVDPPGAPPAVIDLGCEGPAGWRGWSGGARRRLMISGEDATPGYTPGPIEPGRWSVVLGLHALPAPGARVRALVRSPSPRPADHGPRPAPEPRPRPGSARDLPAPTGLRWLAGDTHAHSLHSDGTLSLGELALEGVRSGLDYLCVSEHNTTSHHPLLPAVGAEHGITLVPAQEVTTHRGHANAFGDIGFVDFRAPVADWARTVARRGGLLSINHPVSGDCSWLEEVPSEVGGIEILHADQFRDPLSTAAFAWAARTGAERASRGLPPLSLLGGGDFHSPTTPLRPGTPTTWVCAEDSTPEAVLEALRAGRTAVTTGGALAPDGSGRPDLAHCPLLLRTEEETLWVLDAAGHVLVDAGGRRQMIEGPGRRVPAPRGRGPFRLEAAHRATVAVAA